MAIKRNNSNTGKDFTDNGSKKSLSTRSIGFGSTLGLIGATRGSEYTNTIGKCLQEMYAPLANPPRINIFDRERLPNLEYSCIVVSLNNGNGHICYHISLLEATGAEPMKASDIVTEATRAIREPNTPARIFTPDDAINGILHNIILNELDVTTPNAEFISTDGLVVHASGLEISELAMRVGAIAYNAVSTEAKLSSGEFADLNVTEAVNESGNTMFKLESNLYHTTIQSIVGVPVRQDFKIDLTEVERGSTIEPNADTKRRLVTVGGYIDAIREDITIASQPGLPPVTTPRLHPNIILSNNDNVSPTQGFMLLGMVAATVMTRPELWLQSLASIDSKSPNSPGGLNILTNIENSQNGVGIALDFSSKEVTTEEHYATLTQMYSLTPVISYDIESFGPQAYYTSVLAAAAAPDNTSSKLDALAEIVETCVQLTNGCFPPDFNLSDIFATSGIVIPLGYWMDKSGERDIRDVDMAFVANQTGDTTLINKWGMTALPRQVTGLDPFLTKVEVINALIPDAVINGKAVRVTFTNKFTATLAAAVESAGISAAYDAAMVVTEQYNTGQFTDYLAAAGISSATGFAHQSAVGGNMHNTGYTNMGRNRF